MTMVNIPSIIVKKQEGTTMMKEELAEAIATLDDARCISLTEALVKQGYTSDDVFPIINEGLIRVGAKFAAGEFFIADLIVSGMLVRTIISLLPTKPYPSVTNRLGRIVIGVAAGDIHDIGKDIVVSILRVQGFEVIDLGIDVKASRFLYAVESYKPRILLMSGLLNCTLPCMAEVIQGLKDRGLRTRTAVLVGGGVVGENTAQLVGADAAALDPMDTLDFCLRVAREEEDRLG